MSPDFERLARRLDLGLSDPGLLVQALTHRSASRKGSYERLEFLGDACLGLVVSTILYGRFPEASEGQLTRMRSVLVRGQTLSEIAKELELGDYLVLGSGELKSGGHRRDSILADAVESIIGTLFLDQGLEAVRQFVLKHWSTRLQAVSPDVTNKDAKTRLQEWRQARQLPLPEYQVTSVVGQAPNQVFEVRCWLDESRFFSASAGSRRKAEQQAAADALAWLEEQA